MAKSDFDLRGDEDCAASRNQVFKVGASGLE
jgi:hypothetical protein